MYEYVIYVRNIRMPLKGLLHYIRSREIRKNCYCY